jgi:hypothetical protein
MIGPGKVGCNVACVATTTHVARGNCAIAIKLRTDPVCIHTADQAPTEQIMHQLLAMKTSKVGQ